MHQLGGAAGFLTIYMNILCSLCYKFSKDYTLKDYFLIIPHLETSILIPGRKTVSQPLSIQHNLNYMFCFELKASLGKVGSSLV